MVRKLERTGMRVSVSVEELVFLEKGFHFVAQADLEFLKLTVTQLHLLPECWG